MKDIEGKFITVNQAFVETFKQKSIDDLVGKTDFDITVRELAENYVNDDRNVIASRAKFNTEEEIIDHDVKKWFETYKSPMFDGKGEVIGTAGFARDITERKQSEQMIRENERRYRAQFELASEGIFAVNLDGTLVEVNDAFARMHGFTRDELQGSNLRDLNPSDSIDPSDERTRRILAGEALTFEVRHRHKDGHLIPLEVSASLVTSSGKPTILCFHRDISERTRIEEERRQLEAQARRSEKMESLGSLAGGVAHDMNNVLGAIMALASVHQLNAPEGAALRKDMDTIAKACRRGGTLVKGLLGFAREGLAEEREVDLNDVVREEVSLLERTTLQKVRLVTDLSLGLHPIKGDPSALSHALMNLCVNSVDAMPQGGTLTLRTWNGEDGTVHLEVADTGEGMPREVLEKALDPFFTTKPQGKGTGLGLPIVYGTVKAHQGTLDIRSEPGKGTCISMCFPVHIPVAIEPEPGGEEPPPSSTRALMVLLIDDDVLVLSAVQAILEALGHQAMAVSDGEQAVAELRAGLCPDVVILDMNMPGLDGAGTLPQLRSLRPQVPVLLATGKVDRTVQDLVDAHPGVTLLSKPFSLGELHKNLETISLKGV
jgi:PAS domain S-box-containing protein